MAAVAQQVLAGLVESLRPAADRFREYKRSAALLDFEDLIFSARDLLRNHESMRRALGRRFTHVLVDEFQDTDPLQTEIFWRLCGDPPAAGSDADWTSFRIRPGALFLVGDPKQAIYRFRGADVAAYIRAEGCPPGSGPEKRPFDFHQLPVPRTDPSLCERSIQGPALHRTRSAGLYRSRPVRYRRQRWAMRRGTGHSCR